MGILWQDLRYGLRVLRQRPGFTVVAVIALALGIGANTAIFSVVNTVLLRPLPYAEPDRLIVVVETKLPKFPEFSVSPGNFLDWQKQQTVFAQLEAHRDTSYNLTGRNEPERLRATRVTGGFLKLLGVAPALGRDFLPEEDRPDRSDVVILSHGYWQRSFGGDPQIIGQTLNLSGRPHTVLGVMPVGFQFPNRETELWAPMAFTEREAQSHGAHYISALGRLKPEASLEQARAEMTTIAQRLEQQYPDANAGWGVKLVPLLEAEVGDMRPALLLLLGAVGFVLLIACANVANLLLARAASRQQEISIRAALGAGRWRIIRQLLTESIILALLGGVVGVVLAIWGLDLLLALAPDDLARVQEVGVDGRALGFTLLVTLLTGVLFGLAPALQTSRLNLIKALKEGGRAAIGSGRQRLRNSLVVIEVALALVLLIGAGLLMRSFHQLQQVSLGFKPDNLVVAGLSLPQAKYAEDHQKRSFFTQFIQNLSAQPGVEAVGISQSLPIVSDYVLGFVIEGKPPAAPGEVPSTNYYSVNPDYFKAMGIPLLRGRGFTDRDNQDAPRVALINETFAKLYFPNEDPLGRRIHVTQGPETFREVVGIVGDVKQYGLASTTTAQFYTPYLQVPFSGVRVVVRTVVEPTSVSATLRRQVSAIDKDQPVSTIQPMTEFIWESVATERFSMTLLGVFAAIALVLAGVGLYGVMAYSVTQRTHEIGLRLALGAQRGDVLRLVVRQGMQLAIFGVVLGLIAAWGLTELMTSMLFGISPTDPMTFLGIALLLALIALLASYIPARRATRVDPLVALRYE